MRVFFKSWRRGYYTPLTEAVMSGSEWTTHHRSTTLSPLITCVAITRYYFKSDRVIPPLIMFPWGLTWCITQYIRPDGTVDGSYLREFFDSLDINDRLRQLIQSQISGCEERSVSYLESVILWLEWGKMCDMWFCMQITIWWHWLCSQFHSLQPCRELQFLNIGIRFIKVHIFTGC